MIKISIDLDPVSSNYLDELPKKVDKGLTRSLVKAMLFAEAEAKKIFVLGGGYPLPAPGPLVTRSGHLRRSIRSNAMGNIGWIGTDVKYGAIHELFGAGKKKILRPFLMPSFEGDNLSRIKNIIIDGIIKEVDK